MRRSGCFLLVFLFVFCTASFAQPFDTTINRPYDSLRNLVEKTVRDYQDSLDREKLLENIRTNGKPLRVFLAERREEEKKEKRRSWIRIGAGAIFLFALIFVTVRRYQQRKKP